MMKRTAIPGTFLLVGALLLLMLSLIQLSGQTPLSAPLLLVNILLVLCALAGCTATFSLLRGALFAVTLLASVLWLAWQPIHGLTLGAVALLAMVSVQRLARSTLPAASVAALLGLWLLWFWQILVTGFAVPQVILPAPLDILAALVNSVPLLAGDVLQTVIKSVLAGYLLGSGLGIGVAILIDRLPFLQRGLLPVASLTSTVPLVGVAPIAVMWFGFDWPSKAAVVMLVTFFPALVSTLAGLKASGKLEQELMYCYAATPGQSLRVLRLPAAMPFIFSALKVNATLSLITAIVAEFFGSPTAGLGFRISTESARMHMPVVWSAIVVASIAGSLFYSLLVQLDRRVNFWHPTLRGSAAQK
ncbi:ABC transporter permease [Kosakonia radicincitans]|uniref:ABC transporter permease n=1 Tax=Kosakonia radicincitans TaxID=283686 RepID=UPI001F41E545|nr:ABC transporter permease [Kosakonia radicincitans]